MPRGVGGRGLANIMKHIKGIRFPVEKIDLIEYCQNAQGPDTQAVVSVLQQLPLADNHQFFSSTEILKEVCRKQPAVRKE